MIRLLKFYEKIYKYILHISFQSVSAFRVFHLLTFSILTRLDSLLVTNRAHQSKKVFQVVEEYKRI